VSKKKLFIALDYKGHYRGTHFIPFYVLSVSDTCRYFITKVVTNTLQMVVLALDVYITLFKTF